MISCNTVLLNFPHAVSSNKTVLSFLRVDIDLFLCSFADAVALFLSGLELSNFSVRLRTKPDDFEVLSLSFSRKRVVDARFL